MTKRKTTFYVDEDLLRMARVYAARTGKRDSEVIEEALRALLGVDVLDEIWARSELSEEDAMTLAYEALRATRADPGPRESSRSAGESSEPSRRATG